MGGFEESEENCGKTKDTLVISNCSASRRERARLRLNVARAEVLMVVHDEIKRRL